MKLFGLFGPSFTSDNTISITISLFFQSSFHLSLTPKLKSYVQKQIVHRNHRSYKFAYLVTFFKDMETKIFIELSGRSLDHSYTLLRFKNCGNDPSAGSPTETLLRLHLPLNGKT
eukprot:maker-scaffold_141-snap-gene-0.13-mRNA-1 protein AED:0.47 eAED:0.70 QI:0/0/0/1/0/0/3/0/114